MSYEAIGEITAGRAGHIFQPTQKEPIWVRRPLMGIGAWSDISSSTNFYMIPAMIGLIGILIFYKIWGKSE